MYPIYTVYIGCLLDKCGELVQGQTASASDDAGIDRNCKPALAMDLKLGPVSRICIQCI
jgi:hypothetical protein